LIGSIILSKLQVRIKGSKFNRLRKYKFRSLNEKYLKKKKKHCSLSLFHRASAP
jgi:hypothetical protein